MLTKVELRQMIADDATEKFHAVAADLMTALDILLVIQRSRPAHGKEFAEVQELTRRAYADA